MELDDLKGKIFFKKDNQDGNLSELLYAPIIKLFNPKNDEEFLWGVSSILFLMTWDNIIVSKQLRIEIFELLASLAFYGNDNWKIVGFSFFQAVLSSFNSQNCFGIKNFIDLDSKKELKWEEAFEEAGIQVGFF